MPKMSNKKLIIILLIALLAIITILLVLFTFKKCPEGTISIKELSPQNNQNNVDAYKGPKIVFDGQVEEGDLSFNIKPAIELDISYIKEGGNTAVVLTPVTKHLNFDTEYTISIKTKKSCSKIKELSKGTYYWKFKTATKEYLINQQDQEEENLYKNDPLVKYLPYRDPDDEFEIIYLEGGKENYYKVSLYAIKKTPDDTTGYNVQLKQFHQDALDWIKSKGIDPATLDIKWNPNINYNKL